LQDEVVACLTKQALLVGSRLHGGAGGGYGGGAAGGGDNAIIDDNLYMMELLGLDENCCHVYLFCEVVPLG
jgi:hypothetical protein